MRKQLESFLAPKQKANLMLKAFALTKIPLLFATGAKVKTITDSKCVIEIPYRKIVKNHLGSIYFGAIAIGADACVGLLAFSKIKDSKQPIDLIFKSFSCQFLKRAHGPTFFICEAGTEIDELISKTIQTGERAHKVIQGRAETQGEIIAEFQLELSLKLSNN